MKKLILTSSLLFILGFIPINFLFASTDLGSKLKGRILLQVESSGEAWYVYPDDLKRYYLGRPNDAFNIMRELGLGAKHEFIIGYTVFPQTVWGEILLDVELNGEAYYIYPGNGKKYYLGRPNDAFDIMRELGLGITNNDLDKISLNNKIIIPKTPPEQNDPTFELNSEYLAQRIISLHCLQYEGTPNYLKQLYDKVTYSPNIKGSGVVTTATGEILTNAHVVGIASMCLVQMAQAPNFSVPSPKYYAKLINKDSENDIAKLQIYESVSDDLPSFFPHFPVRNIEVDLGDKIYVIGFSVASNNRLAITEGIISGRNDVSGYIPGVFLITSAKIDSGNSGGAVITPDGNLIGLPTYIQGNYENLGYILDLSRINY